MSLRLALCLAFVAVAFSNVSALSDEEKAAIKDSVLKYVQECSQEYDISEEKIKEAKEKKSSEGIEPCAIGCVFKKAQFINGQGLFDPEIAKKIGAKYIKGEEDRKQYAEIADGCASVNDEDVSDGDKGCERAKLLLACMAKHKDAFQL